MKFTKKKKISCIVILIFILILAFIGLRVYVKYYNQQKIIRYIIVGLMTDSNNFGTPEERAVITEIDEQFKPLYERFNGCDNRLWNSPILSPQSLENVESVKQMATDTNCMVEEIPKLWDGATKLYNELPREFITKYPEHDFMIREYFKETITLNRSDFMIEHTNKQIDYYLKGSEYYGFILKNYQFLKFTPNEETKIIRIKFTGPEELKVEYEQLVREATNAEQVYFDSYKRYAEYTHEFFRKAGIILPDDAFEDKLDVHT